MTRWIASMWAVGAAALTLHWPGSPASAGSARLLELPEEQAFIERAARGGQSRLAVLIAARLGRAATAAALIEQLGGQVVYRADDFDYLRADLPIGALANLKDATGVIEACQLGRSMFEGVGADLQGIEETSSPWMRPPDANTRDGSPYLPTDDMHAPEFRRQHAGGDGAGVVIGVIEGLAADLTQPAFAPFADADGKSQRKVIKIIRTGDEFPPLEPFQMGRTQSYDTALVSADRDGVFLFNGSKYVRAPRWAVSFRAVLGVPGLVCAERFQSRWQPAGFLAPLRNALG